MTLRVDVIVVGCGVRVKTAAKIRARAKRSTRAQPRRTTPTWRAPTIPWYALPSPRFLAFVPVSLRLPSASRVAFAACRPDRRFEIPNTTAPPPPPRFAASARHRPGDSRRDHRDCVRHLRHAHGHHHRRRRDPRVGPRGRSRRRPGPLASERRVVRARRAVRRRRVRPGRTRPMHRLLRRRRRRPHLARGTRRASGFANRPARPPRPPPPPPSPPPKTAPPFGNRRRVLATPPSPFATSPSPRQNTACSSPPARTTASFVFIPRRIPSRSPGGNCATRRRRSRPARRAPPSVGDALVHSTTRAPSRPRSPWG